MSDNRRRPRIHRTDDKHDKALRDYAAEHGIEPWKALEVAIQRLAWTDGPTIDTLRADLESAREATRRADAEVERVTADWRAALAETERVKALALERAGADATEIKRLTVEATVRAREYAAAAAKLGTETERLQRELAASQARERQADEGAMDARVEAPAPCAPRNKWRRVVSPDLAARVDARIDARPGRDFVFVLDNGCSRLEASDDYQDRQKAAKRAARGA